MKSKWTSIFGILSGLPSFLATVGIALPPKIGGIVSTVGVVGLGLLAKDFNQHSTQEEVTKATAQQ